MATQTESTGWTSFFAQASDAWLENCKAVSGSSQAIASRWLKDCSDQLQSNLDTWTQLAGCRDTTEAAQIQQRWWQGTVDRMNAEIQDCQERMATWSQQGLSPTRPAEPARPARSPSAAAE